jgi:hypothetical protein
MCCMLREFRNGSRSADAIMERQSPDVRESVRDLHSRVTYVLHILSHGDPTQIYERIYRPGDVDKSTSL